MNVLTSSLDDVNGNVVGYIAEEDKGFSGALARQAFRTHRAFRSVIMDVNGTPVLWVSRNTGSSKSLLTICSLGIDSPPVLLDQLSFIRAAKARRD